MEKAHFQPDIEVVLLGYSCKALVDARRGELRCEVRLSHLAGWFRVAQPQEFLLF